MKPGLQEYSAVDPANVSSADTTPLSGLDNCPQSTAYSQLYIKCCIK